jgi:hypothetical protein
MAYIFHVPKVKAKIEITLPTKESHGIIHFSLEKKLNKTSKRLNK